MNNEKYLAKIKKLLNLARRSTNQNEAANAISQAQNLMRAHNLTETDVDLMDIDEFSSKGAPSNAVKIPAYATSLANMICSAFGVRCYHSYNVSRRVVVFYGPNERPQIAAYGFDVLSRQLIKARNEFSASQRKSIKRSTKINRADQFCEGWVLGAQQVIESFIVSEPETTLMTAYYNRLKSEFGHKTLAPRTAKKCRGDDIAKSAGYQAGQEAKLHHAVDGSQQEYAQIGRQ